MCAMEVCQTGQVGDGSCPGRFALDTANKCLWDGEIRHDLTPKAFDVLDFLRRHPDRLVTHDDILDAVWPNTFVQPEIVKTYVRTLRRLFGDDVRSPKFIETRPRSGYRFIGRLGERTGGLTVAEKNPNLFGGRERERAIMRRAFTDAERGARTAVFFTGESGIGKSMVVDQLSSELGAAPGTVTATAYGCAGSLSVEPLSLGIALLQNLATALGGNILRDLATLHAHSWLSHLGDASERGDMSRDGSRTNTAAFVREACLLVEQATKTATIVLAIDDLQWADRMSLAFVNELMHRRYPARLVLIASFRQTRFEERCPIADTVNRLAVQGAARVVPLPALDEITMEAIVRAQRSVGHSSVPAAGLGKPQPDTGVRDIVQRSCGNPAIAKALAEDYIEATQPVALSPPNGRYEARRQYKAIYGRFDLQLNEFGSFLRSALEAGSVAGCRFCAWAVATMLDTEQARVEDVVARLASSGQFLALDSWYALPDGTSTPLYIFRHPFQRQFLLESQAPSRRSERHRKFGQAIVGLWGVDVKEVANDVSYCFSAAGDWAQAIGYARLAASKAVERSSPNEATRLLKKALGLSSRLPAGERMAIQLPIREDLMKLGSKWDAEDEACVDVGRQAAARISARCAT